VILDPRITQLWYGRKFLQALPPGIKLTTIDPRADEDAADYAPPMDAVPRYDD